MCVRKRGREGEGGRERERELAYYIVDDDNLLLPAAYTPSGNHWHCFNHWFSDPLQHSQHLSSLMMAVDLFMSCSYLIVATDIFPQFIWPKIGSMWHAHDMPSLVSSNLSHPFSKQTLLESQECERCILFSSLIILCNCCFLGWIIGSFCIKLLSNGRTLKNKSSYEYSILSFSFSSSLTQSFPYLVWLPFFYLLRWIRFPYLT